MDFVDFCGVVLNKLIEARRNSHQARELGQLLSEITTGVFDEGEDAGADSNSILLAVLSELRKMGLAGTDSSGLLWKVSQSGVEVASNMTTLWEQICTQKLEPDQEKLLCTVNQLSQRPTATSASILWVGRDELLSNGWADAHLLFPVASELENLGLVVCDARMGGYIRLQSTYSGLVWEYRRGLTLESKSIDELVVEWETTNVDFKQELYLDTASQKAEFVKDVLGLANTKSSGRRWLIIGFNDKTHEYHGPPDPRVTHDRIEDLLSHYTSPFVDARYEIVEYRAGKVGKLEILRNPARLPYSAAQSVGEISAGDKKRIREGQVFVRHGSRTVLASPEELSDLQAEGDRARTS